MVMLFVFYGCIVCAAVRGALGRDPRVVQRVDPRSTHVHFGATKSCSGRSPVPTVAVAGQWRLASAPGGAAPAARACLGAIAGDGGVPGGAELAGLGKWSLHLPGTTPPKRTSRRPRLGRPIT